MATYFWWSDRRVAVDVLCDSISAQECADLIVMEMREEGISFNEVELAESVAAVLLQQRLDLAGFVDAHVEQNKDGVFDVIGCAHRCTGEKIEFMSRLSLWLSSGGQVHCDSLGLVWR